MKPQEAIEYLKGIRHYEYDNTDNLTREYNKAIDAAMTALEKQMPKKPDGRMNPKGFRQECPSCDEYVTVENFCPNCGQAIDWSADEN